MRTRILRSVYVLILVPALAGSAPAAIPKAIPLQAVLRDSAGRPITNATQFVALSIYDAATGGALLYTETKTVAVTNGLCATTIGTGNPSAFAALPFDAPYWVGIRVGSDAEMSPRIALASAPYALNSGSVAYTAVTGAPATLPPSGAAGGDLTGSYPNPSVGAGTIDSSKLASDIHSLSHVSGDRMTFSNGAWTDQNCTGSTAVGSLPAWQSFTPALTGYLSAIYLWIGSSSGSAATVTLQIFAGEGTTGTLLYSQDFPTATLGQRFIWFTNPLAVTKDVKYTWYVTTPSAVNIRYAQADGYARGRSGLDASWDYYFRTLMSPLASNNMLTVRNTLLGSYGFSVDNSFGEGLYASTTHPGSSGVYATNGWTAGTYAATFSGDVRVLDGNLSVTGTLTKGAGSFKIDHPLDPANKTLSHSFVESPDMMNVYNGNVKTDGKGRATVRLPEYFQALNKDFRYQLTTIGSFAAAMVERKIANNRFTIRTSKPFVEVSWQVTGIRNDAYARDHRINTEETKPKEARGTYLYPAGFPKARTATNR